MSKPLWRLKVRTHFCASHQLRHYQGKCENLHGHNFTVEAEVEGEQLDPKTGILIDFKVLKRDLGVVIDELDHTHLNDLSPFQDQNPSSELLAQHIYYQLGERLSGKGVRVRSVTVMEKSTSMATYLEA